MIRDAIDAVPTILGRLLLMSRMMDDESGTYAPWLAGIPCKPTPENNAALEALHRDLLMKWLTAGVETRISDAVEFLRETAQHKTQLDQLQHGGMFIRLLPLHVERIHQEHFLNEISHIIAAAVSKQP